MTQPAKAPESSMEEILASIRRIINDVHDEPGTNLRDGLARQETASRERMWPTASPPAEPSGGDSVAENLSRDGWSVARPVRPIRSSEEGLLAPADAQPGAASAVAAADDEGASEPRPPQRSTRLMLSSVPRPASAEQEIDEIIAHLHSGSHPGLPADEDDVSDALETSGQMRVPEALPADEFADPGDFEQPQEVQEPNEAEVELPPAKVTEPPQPIAGMQPAPRAPHFPKYESAPPSLRSNVHDQSRGDGPGLVSAATSAAVDSAFNTLAQTVLVQNGPTLEELARQMLRPMLKTWLDDNLPGLVERLVRAEIERVSRGRG
jgi:cell pole-organizing protein PopZ